MERYDRLRAEGTDPVEAMRRVAPDFDAPPMWTGQPGPHRAALTERDAARRPGDAEITRYRGETATTQPDTAQRVPAPPGPRTTRRGPDRSVTRSGWPRVRSPRAHPRPRGAPVPPTHEHGLSLIHI